MKNETKQFYDAIKNVEKNKYWEVMSDAHTIFKPSAFTDLGLPEEFVLKYAHTYRSDTSSPKSTIYGDNGEVIHSLQGVMSSTIANALTNLFGLQDAQREAGQKMGRGSALRVLSQAVWEHTH